MRFAYPLLLLLVPAIAAGGVALYRHAKTRAQRKLARFSPVSRLPNMLRSVDYRAKARKAALLTAALCLLAVAIARPLWGPRPDSEEQTGAEFFIVLDVSKSMLVRDVPPNRLEAVKASLAKWLKTRRGDRIGLILMAGDAFVQAPLTNDYTALREVLEQSGPASISLGGTNIPNAVKVAVKAMEASGVKHKAVVLVSDGENLEGHAAGDIEQARAVNKITFFTIGVGTLEGGKVPEKDSKPDFSKPPKAYVKDDYGVTAHSRLDERTLRAIATNGGGRYFSFTPEGDVWNALYVQGLAPLAKRTDTFNIQQYNELFQIPLFLAIALLVLEMAISTRHKKPARPRSIVTLPEPATAPTAAHMR
jgi:Mg-chelatase subunit ChlD